MNPSLTLLSMRLMLVAAMAVSVVLVEPASAQTTFTVTVAPKSTSHPMYNQGWPETYLIDGVEAATLSLQRGTTYRFEMQQVPGLHPFYISTSSSGAGAGVYSDGVQGNFAVGNDVLIFTPPDDAPAVLYYQCQSHDGMGWTMNISGSVSAEDEFELPNTIILEQNYPNPFNPSTVIPFRLSNPADVTLKVYDLRGRKVATLLNEHLPAGAHLVEWRADGQAILSSSAFIYSLSAGEQRVQRLMTLLK